MCICGLFWNTFLYYSLGILLFFFSFLFFSFFLYAFKYRRIFLDCIEKQKNETVNGDRVHYE